MANSKFRVKLIIEDRSLQRHLEGIVRAENGFTIIGSDDPLRADLVFFELTDKDNKHVEEFEFIKNIINTGEAGEVFLVRDEPESEILLKAIKIGAREFFSQPLEDNEIKQALDNFKIRAEKVEQEDAPQNSRILTFLGSKGGSGTTTLAVNLAVNLAEDSRVALVDMNQLFGEIPHFLDMQTSYSWGEIIKNTNRLDSTFLLNILSRHASGVYVLPSPSYLSDENLATPEVIERLLRIMRRMFDYIVIDAGQSLDSVALKILEMSDTVFIISILSVPCLSNTNKLLRSFRALGFPSQDRLKVVINRYIKKSSITLEDAKNAIEHDIYWKVPNDYSSTVSAINRGTPLNAFAPRTPIAINIKQLADEITEKTEKKGKRLWKLFK